MDGTAAPSAPPRSRRTVDPRRRQRGRTLTVDEAVECSHCEVLYRPARGSWMMEAFFTQGEMT